MGARKRLRGKKNDKSGAPQTQGDALAAIAAESPETVKVVGDIMESNARSLDALNENLLEAEKAAHRQTLSELKLLEYRLNDIQERVEWLMGGEIPASLRVEIESIVEDEVSEIELRTR